MKGKALCVAAAFFLLLCGCSAETVPFVTESFLMDTPVMVTVYDDPEGDTAFAAVALINEVEDKYSSHMDSSLISRINQQAGKEPVEIDSETEELLQEVIRLAYKSDGMFDVTVGPLSELWNITAENAAVPAQEDIELALALVDYKSLTLAHGTAYLPLAGQKIDLGGAAKGLACQKVYDLFCERDAAGLLSLGGSIAVHGKKPDESSFSIGLRDPFGSEGSYCGIFTMEDGFAATSGNYERFFEKDGIRYHHILDPFTGYPADSQWMSVTVFGQDGVMCDILSTWFYTLSPSELKEAAEKYGVSVIAVDENKVIYRSDSAPVLHSVDTSFTESVL